MQPLSSDPGSEMLLVSSQGVPTSSTFSTFSTFRSWSLGAGRDPREDGIQWLPSTTVMALRLLRHLDRGVGPPSQHSHDDGGRINGSPGISSSTCNIMQSTMGLANRTTWESHNHWLLVVSARSFSSLGLLSNVASTYLGMTFDHETESYMTSNS